MITPLMSLVLSDVSKEAYFVIYCCFMVMTKDTAAECSIGRT